MSQILASPNVKYNTSNKYNVVEELQDYMFTSENLARYNKDIYKCLNNSHNEKIYKKNIEKPEHIIKNNQDYKDSKDVKDNKYNKDNKDNKTNSIIELTSVKVEQNDYNNSNPFPRAQAINIKRDTDNLKDFL